MDDAWKFQQHCDAVGRGQRAPLRRDQPLAAVYPGHERPRLHKPDEYYTGQDLGGLFAEVGPSVPAQYQSPYRSEMNS